MSNTRNDDFWIFLTVAGIASAAIVVWKFSTFFGLDMHAGGSVIIRLVVLSILIGVSWKFGDDVEQIRPGNIWPILLALFGVCWFPAMDYWAAEQYPSFFEAEEKLIWWNAWYVKLGGFVTILIAGYYFKNKMENR